MSNPLVSICMVTYNHERFIAQAIESVLMQQTSFEYELVIGDDHSTDKTREIIVEYKKKYGDKIIALLHPQNLGLKGKNNFAAVFNIARGKYIHILEGDDYWTHSEKLQKQVDFLENHSEFALCFHNLEVKNDNAKESIHFSNIDQVEETTIEDIARGNFIYTASCLFRNNLFGKLPGWYFEVTVGDYLLHILNAQFGKIKYINEVMGVYRIHGDGVWSNQTQVNMFINWVEVQEVLIGKFSKKVNDILAESQVEILYKLFQHFESQGDSEKASAYLKRIMQRKPDFMYKQHVQALHYQQALLYSQSYKLGHLLLQPLRIFKKKQK